jgi:iron complex transport system permease protein
MKPPVKVARFGRFSFRYRGRSLLACALLLLVIANLGLLLMATGRLSFTLQEVLASLAGPSANPIAERVLWQIRLPRVLTALLVGGSLGASGAVFQSISRNILGSPDIIGFTTGAATGAIVQIILFDAGAVQTAVAAVLSGMATAALVFMVAAKGRKSGAYHLVLAGIGVGATLSGVNTVFLVMGDLDQAASAQLWLAGSLNARTWSHVLPAAAGFCILLPLAIRYGRRLALMEMGDDVATQLGIPVERTRLSAVLVAVALAAISTAAAGPIAFVAFAAPQLARRLTGSADVPILSGALSGMVLLLGADYLTQNMPFQLYLPIGLTTGLIGGIYLVWLLSRDRA